MQSKSACESQIADPTADLFVPGIARGLPERARRLVLEGDQGRHPPCATAAQVLLAGARQRDPDALAPMALADGEPVQVPPPTVPGGDQGADDLPAALGTQEGGRGISNQVFDVVEAVGRSCVPTPRLGP